MRQTESGTNLTARNRYVRMCIARALIQLMRQKALEQITVTELVKLANVSRMTFYKYYVSKAEVLKDYVYELMNEYVEEVSKRLDIGRFRELKHITHCFEFFRKYSKELMILVHANMYGAIISVVNDYMDKYVEPESNYSKYELYYYAGALCNTYIKWVEAGMIETPEEIATIVYKHLARI